jgi:hypothetical protein
MCDLMTDDENVTKDLKAQVAHCEKLILALEAKLESYEADYVRWKKVVDKLGASDYE